MLFAPCLFIVYSSSLRFAKQKQKRVEKHLNLRAITPTKRDSLLTISPKVDVFVEFDVLIIFVKVSHFCLSI